MKSVYESFFQNLTETHIVNLYLHIPFCSRICSYCNCFKNLIRTENDISGYISLLEINCEKIFKENSHKKISVKSIFIGWGTPNILSVWEFERLFLIIDTYFDTSSISEYLLDWHPNYYSSEKIELFYKYGITRVTLAIQSYDQETLLENNRDVYRLKDIKNIIYLLKKYGIKSNIDLLVWLRGQTKASAENDIEITRTLWVDNVSIHYFMQSNNIHYVSLKNYSSLVSHIKQYLSDNPLPNKNPNIQENYYASRESSTIWIGAHAVTHLFWKIIYKNSWISEYKNTISWDFFSMLKWKKLSMKDEMIKYIYLNILTGINIEAFEKLFWKNIFTQFPFEFRFLHDKKVVYKKDNLIFSYMDDLNTFVYFNIFFINELHKIHSAWDVSSLECFFNKKWELIDT